MLVVTTAGFGYVMGSGEVVDYVKLAWTSAGTMMAACSANAFNQIMEIANDSRMKRTMRRPLPSGRMSVPHALAFAVTMGVGGVLTLAYQTNTLTAELGAANLLLYTLVYTPLKQVHWINTWIGAVVGAIPPLMGWAAAAGQVDAGGWILGALLYFWQIPHFMALAFLCRQDYAAGRYRMLSIGDFSGRRTALAAVRNCIYLIPLGFLAQDCNMVSGSLGTQMLLLSAGFGASATAFYLSPTSVTARKMFRASLLYLPIIMGAMLFQRIPNPNLKSQEDDDLEDEVATSKLLDVRSPWSLLPPIATLSAAPFPFLPAPEDRTIAQ
jgi:protoheme IX farnesyltransferase